MRLARLLPVLLASGILLAACGDDDDEGGNGGQQARGCSPKPPESKGWAGSPEGGGAAEVARFNKYLSVPAAVADSPCDAASVFLHLDRPQGEGVDVDVEVEPEEAADATATVTLDNLPDDSVRAERWELDFDEEAGGTIRLASAKLTFRCQPDRGHQNFSSELCI